MDSKKQWVQHISGQGEKWELHPEYIGANSYEKGTAFTVVNKQSLGPVHRLPRSEYRLCEPPERWVDVTETTHDISNVVYVFKDYRFRKIHLSVYDEAQWAFIIEQKVSE